MKSRRDQFRTGIGVRACVRVRSILTIDSVKVVNLFDRRMCQYLSTTAPKKRRSSRGANQIARKFNYDELFVVHFGEKNGFSCVEQKQLKIYIISAKKLFSRRIRHGVAIPITKR